MALAAAGGIAILLYESLVAGDGLVPPGEFGGGWPFRAIGSRALRLAAGNAAVIAGGFVVYLALARAADLEPATISAVAGAAVAAGLIVGMLFEGWLTSMVTELAGVAIAAALLYAGLKGYAHVVGWTRAEPEEWIAYAGLNAIGAGVILHVAIGHRWPFASR